MPPQPSDVAQSVRADHVISRVLSVLSPLVSPSQNESLRKDLLTLANSAIDVWNNTQSGELKITVTPLLEREHRKEWRSQLFDPLDHDEKNLDVISKTHPRIVTLFPQSSLGKRQGRSNMTMLYPEAFRHSLINNFTQKKCAFIMGPDCSSCLH
ncbi:hypothetical protein VC83_04071 [Pseudogymnoascus destructans]|uniref:Uncharacterized protein n=2 Tax=Pseudogymnoascus destructans TaxID=655981 RepID=L8G965_PSED2|nr:uncharacterized protein VC83_04071 [Pseudogymnoascus destructans]ELR08576.1 hypothetical protein GMDG_03271 [Pseudogymnoascus destructans 20631-21]OAF59540.1 hypothetical protein VC83_04071 [Pseudogymnoascus destructans]